MSKKTVSPTPGSPAFVAELKAIVASARGRAYAAINFAQVEANWLIGRQIVEEEQHGKARAAYGKGIIALASRELTKEFGAGFSERNLKNFRRFYLTFSHLQIGQTVSAQLENPPSTPILPLSLSIGQTPSAKLNAVLPGASPAPQLPLLPWSHYERLLRVDSAQAREWYLREAAEQSWTIGILLCSETDRDIARYSVLKGSEQLFATKYKLYLPTEEELRAEIARQKELLALPFARQAGEDGAL